MTGSTVFPGAEPKPRPELGGVKMGGVTKLVLHSTESSGLPAYPTFVPTLTFDPWALRWYQHLPLDVSATTLADPSSTAVRENRDDVVQVEVVGYADPKQRADRQVSKMTDAALRELARLVAFLHVEWGLPLESVPASAWLPYPRSYGATPYRMSGPAYDAFTGVLGHQHVSGNDHGDPGDVDVAQVMEYARAAVSPPAWDGKSYPGADAFLIGRSHPAVTLLGRRLVVHGFAKRHDAVGGYTPGPTFTEYDRANVADFQASQGWSGSSADGYPGPRTWMLLMEAPEVVAPAPPPKPAPKPRPSVTRRVLVLNSQLPAFVHDRSTLPGSKRYPLQADMIRRSGAPVVCVQEIDAAGCVDLAGELGPRWRYQRSKGAGLNAVFRQDGAGLLAFREWVLPSYGQRVRTLVLCELRYADGGKLSVGTSHFAAAASDLPRARANAAKFAQVKRVHELVAPLGGQVVLGVDLARADDDDDVAWLKAHGWGLPGRTDRTPLVAMTRGVHPSKVDVLARGRAFDHDAYLLTLTATL